MERVSSCRFALALCVGLLGCLPAVARAETLGVPVPFATIQSAVDAAFDGDLVLVEPGTYVGSVDFLGKAITVMSSSGAEHTILQGTHEGTVVLFTSGEGREAVLDGFTVRGGHGTIIESGRCLGGGIFCRGSSPTIRNNTITENFANCLREHLPSSGGGIAALDGEPLIEGNRIEANEADLGAGIYVEGGVISSNWILQNSGMGIYLAGTVSVLDNVIENNADSGVRGTLGGGEIRRNTVAGNRSTETAAPGLHVLGTFGSEITDNRIYGNHSVDRTALGGGAYLSGIRLFARNVVEYNTAGRGAGIVVRAGLSRIVGNVIRHNVAEGEGGGIYSIASEAGFVHNMVVHNIAGTRGGGMYDASVSGSHICNTFAGNTAGSEGGGLYIQRMGGVHDLLPTEVPDPSYDRS